MYFVFESFIGYLFVSMLKSEKMLETLKMAENAR